MTSYEPDPKIANLFSRYKRAYETERDLKPHIREAAETAIRAGASNQELAALTGLTPEYFRKIATAIGVDNRRRAPTVGREAEARRSQTSRENPAAQPAPTATAPETRRGDDRIARLSDSQTLELCERAYAFATERQAAELDALPGKDGPEHARAVIAAAIAMNPPLLTHADLNTV